MLLHELLSSAAARRPEAIAVIHGHETVSYRQLHDRAAAIAAVLEEHGVRRGDRVVLALENSIPFVASYFGILIAGGVVVPVAPGAQNDRLAPTVDDCEPTALIADESTASIVAAAHLPSLRLMVIVGARQPNGFPVDPAVIVVGYGACIEHSIESPPHPRLADVDLAAVVYTSGSTGAPRGVMLSHLNLVANTRSILGYLPIAESDRMMVVMPFYYVYGLSLLHTHIAAGAALVLENRLLFPNVVVGTMQEHRATALAGVPSTFALLLHHSTLARTPLPALRYVTQAGGAMPPALVDEWLAALPAVPLYVMYGATEAGARLAYLDPSELARRRGSIGRAIPNVELIVMTDDGAVAAAGVIGELVARGPNISSGYWRCPQETQEVFTPEGYRTGDLGYVDEDGFIYVVGRLRDMIKVGAHRVGPLEIENVVQAHPAVHEAAVVGTPDDLLGEVPVVFFTRRGPLQVGPADLREFCRARLPGHKVPARFIELTDLPRSGAGKIQKNLLREQLTTNGPVASWAS